MEHIKYLIGRVQGQKKKKKTAEEKFVKLLTQKLARVW